MPSDKPSNRQSVNTGLRMWQSLKDVAGLANYYSLQGMHSRELPSDTSLPDKLNYFYACFEANNTETCMRAPAVLKDCVITLSEANVSKTFRQVNIHKAAGHRQITRTCTASMR
jgi:hypothetical protein